MANCVDLDEMANYEPSHLDLQFAKVSELVSRDGRVPAEYESVCFIVLSSRAEMLIKRKRKMSYFISFMIIIIVIIKHLLKKNIRYILIKLGLFILKSELTLTTNI